MIVEFFLYIPGLSAYAGKVYLQLDDREYELFQRKDLQEDIFQVRLAIDYQEFEYCFLLRKEKNEERCEKIKRSIFDFQKYQNYDKISSSIQFFDTPEKFQETFLLFLHKKTLKQTDIQNSILMFAQTNSNSEMIRGLINFIKKSNFENERELLKKLEEKELRHAQELLKLERFDDILDKFDIFKNNWFQSQLLESSQILWNIRFKAPAEILKRVNSQIVELKRSFSLEQLMKELFKSKPIFPMEELVSEVTQRINAVQSSHELTQIQEYVNNEQRKMSNEALVLLQRPLRLFWERSWQFQTKETPSKSLKFLIRFKLQMKQIIQDNPNSLRDLFTSCSNYPQHQFEELFSSLLLCICDYLTYFDPKGEAISLLFKKAMTKSQTKQLFLLLLQNKVVLKVNIKELCQKIADSFKNVNEAIEYYWTVIQFYGKVDIRESLFSSFNSLVNELSSRQLFFAIGFISPFTNLSKLLQTDQDKNAFNSDKTSLGEQMREIIIKKFSEVALSDLLEGINSMINLEECQDYYQVIVLGFRNAAQKENKNGKDLFDLLKSISQKIYSVNSQMFPFKVQIFQAAIQEIENILLQKYLDLRETGNNLSSPYTLKMILSINKQSKIRAEVFTDIKTFVEQIHTIDFQTFENKIKKSKELEQIFEQFSQELHLDFSSFIEQNSQIIQNYNSERQKLNYFFARFGEYLMMENTEFEKKCLKNVLLGETKGILKRFNHLQLIYNFYYHLRESKIFLNMVFFFEQKSLQKKSLNTLNTILYETKNALIQFIFLINNTDSNLTNFDDAYLSILSQYKIEHAEKKQLQDQIANYQKIFPKGVLNLSILRDLAGQSFEEMTEKIQQLFQLTKVDFNEIVLTTIQGIAKVQYLLQQSQTIINLITQFKLPESNENFNFIEFLSTFQNPEEQPINLLVSHIKDCDFNLGNNFFGKLPTDKEIQKIEQLHEILEYSQKNLKTGSFLEMRDLIDDDDTESMSLIIKLDSLKPLLNVLQELKRGYEEQKKHIPQFPVFSKLMEDLIMITRCYLNSAEIVSNVEECSRNFFKISQVSQSFEKKKSFITLAREIVKQGIYSFSLSPNDYRNVEIFVECPKKKYTQSEILQVCSRVILEQKTNTSIVAFGEQKISDAKKLFGLATVEQGNDYDFEGQEQRKEQALKQLNNDIDQFKEQWFQAEELKEVFFQLISYGNFEVLEQNRIYSNQNDSFNTAFQLMKDDNKRLFSELESWKEQIRQIFSIYPSFSLVGFRHYRQLSYYLAGKVETISYDLRQILHALGIQDNRVELILSQLKQQKEKQGIEEIKLTDIEKVEGQLFQIDSISNHVIKYFFPGVREIIKFLVLKASQLCRAPQFYQYFFYNSESDLSDMEQFFYRFQFLTIPGEKLEFFLIFSTDIKEDFYCATQELLARYFNNFKQRTANKLNILLLSSGKQYQNFSSIPEQYIDYWNEFKYIKQSAFFSKCHSKAAFYFSEFPGEGKTLTIKKAGNLNNSQVRIPTSSSENKSSFLSNFQMNVQQLNKHVKSIHIDLYESETYDLNILLFELIFLRSVSLHSERLMILDSEVNIHIEIANTLQQSLLKSLYLFEIIQKIKIKFDLNQFYFEDCFQSKNQHKNAAICYKYLLALNKSDFTKKDMNVSQIKKLQLDAIDTTPLKINLSQQEQKTFKCLLYQYVVQKIVDRGSQPCFYQIHRFIDLFGSEMIRFEKCIFLKVENINLDLLKQGIRTKIVEMSYRLCIEISMSRSNISQMQLNLNDRKEVIMERISKSIDPFSKCVVNFVTFQEQELSSITTFFDRESSVPDCLKTLFNIYNKKMMFFDEENKPEDLLHWLILFINQNEQFMYKYQGSTVYSNIANKQLRHLVRRITILKDNFFKMATLFMRIRSNTPLIIMGEAGIGKTVLIELMSNIMEAKFQTMIVHTGISDQQVVDFVEAGIRLQEQIKQRVILFFDEVNASKMIGGLFKEILIDRCMKGIQLPESIIPIAAINPYKLKSEAQKNMLNCQIHGGIKKEMIQKITRKDLEYMVEPMPESMYSLIWNFDSLSLEDEKKYILKMVQIKNQIESKKLKKNSEGNIFNEDTLKSIAETVFQCQQHIRTQMGYSSACSLRDVARFLNILYWMQNFLKICKVNKGLINLNELMACPCLAFYIIYYVRLPLGYQRQQFIEICALSMKKRKSDYYTIIAETQQFLIEECDVPAGIVKNSALKENVFSLFVSIINKLPVVLIGPPGSSKTQSIKILIQTMKGKQSFSPFFKNFQALIPLFYQGHLQSTSERILEVFQKAIDKQDRIEKDKQSDEYLSLVYIEEIGLADISPHNPLKVLHATLENPKVAVACISNWPLDQSKMNRMVSICRLNTTEEELKDTILHIWKEFKDNSESSIQMALQTLLPNNLPSQIAKIYEVYLENLKIAQPKFEQFHGMRDFYGMVKLFCYQEVEFLKSKQNGGISNAFKLNLRDRVCYAFQRHFSGLLQSQDILKNVIFQYLYESQQNPVFDDSLYLINTHLSEESHSHYIPRHLMIITDNLSSSIEYLSSRLLSSQKSVKTIVGGEFSNDMNQERAYDIINEIIGCVEQGTILILSNLDRIYQSFYELLNQSYRNFNGKNYCKISFGADSNNIEVSPLFKLILVVHVKDLQRLDGPLLNRFEKHFLSSSILLTLDDQHQIQTVKEYFQEPKRANLFRFNNLIEMINTLVAQKRFLQESASNSDLTQQLYHLAPIGKMIEAITPTDDDFKQKYIESNLHFDLDGLIKQKIDSYKRINNNNTELICIVTPSSFVSTFTQYFSTVINISAILSTKKLEITIQDFFKEISQSQRSQLVQDPEILIIVFGQDEPVSKVRLVQQKVGETITSFKNLNKQVFVILIVQVQENFNMVQFSGKWELYYLEDLKPLHFIADKHLIEMLSLKKWFSDLNQPIFECIDLSNVLDYFLSVPENITTSYLRLKYKKISQGYQLQRIKQLLTIFDLQGQNQNQKQLQQFSSKIVLLKSQLLLKELKIQSVEQFLKQYVIQYGFIKQSQSLPNAILKALMNLLSHSLAFFLSVLERNNLIYAYFQAPSKSNDYLSFLQTNTFEILRIKGYDNLESLNQLDFQELDFTDQFQLETESINFSLPICQKIFENMTGFLKRPKSSTNEINLEIIDTMMSLISEKDQVILKKYDEEASQDFIKYNCQGMSKLDIEVVNQLIPPSKTQTTISFLRFFACNYFFKKEIHMITSLLSMFYWIEDPFKLCKGYKPEDNQEQNVKTYARFLLKKIFLMIKPSPYFMKLVKQKQIDIITTIQFILRFIQSIEIEREEGVLNIKQQLITLQNFLLLFPGNNNISQDLLGLVDLQKINSLEIFYIKDLKAFLQALDSKSAMKQSLQLEQLEIYDKCNSKMTQTQKIFQQNWVTFILDLLQSVVQSRQNESFIQLCVEVVNYLSFIESDHLASGSEIKDKMVIQINVILSEVAKKCTQEMQLFDLFHKGIEEIIPQAGITSESTTIVVLSSCIQQYIVSNTLRTKKQLSILPQFLTQNPNLEGLNLLQKAIYLAIFREVTQISIEAIEQPDLKPFDQSITQFFGSNLSTYLEIHIAKQFYHKYKEGPLMISSQKKSQYFQFSSWLEEYATPFTGLLSSAFLNSYELNSFQRLFLNNSSEKQALKQLFLEELPNSKNIFGQIYRGNFNERMFYPFMMLNNILLIQSDSQDNSQLYQCNNCKEFVFSDKCPNLTSKAACARCKKQIAKDNNNTIQVLKYANNNPTKLNEIIQTNQWMGYYIRIQEEQDAFKLAQGNSFDLRLFIIAYNLAFFYAYSKEKKYTEKKDITVFNGTTHTESNSIQEEITRVLRIDFQANPLEFLEEQIDYALLHISKIASSIFNMSKEEKSIVIYKLLIDILSDQSIVSSDDSNKRSDLNSSISQKIERTVQLSKQIILNKNNPLISIVLEADQFQALLAHTQFKINLRATTRANSPSMLIDHLRLNLPNNTYLILKDLLDLSKLEYTSQSLKVLVKFSQLMNQHLSKMFTQKIAQEITLLEALQGDVSHPLFKFFIQEFIPVWEKIRDHEKEFIIGCQSVTIQPVREDTKICNLVLSSDKQYGFFSNVLEILCNIQNNILEKILANAKQEKTENNNSDILFFIEHLYEREEKDQNQDIDVKPIEQIDTELNIIQPYNPDTLSQYIINDIAYSKGRKLIWDLDGLQKELARQVISNTVKISLENSQMYPFLVEVTQINILNIDIPQQPLSQQQKNQLEAALQSREEGIDLLLKVATLFAIFKSEKNSANLNLEQALLSIQIKIPPGKIRTLFSSSLQLRHINGVIQVLENRNMDQLIEGCNPIYRQEIERLQLQRTMEFLNKTNILQNFSNALGRFIIRCLSQNQEAINEKSKLFEQLFDKMTYEDFWDDPSVLNQLYQQASKDETKIGQAYVLFHETTKAIKMKKQQYYFKQNESQQLYSQKDSSGMLMDSFTDKIPNLGQAYNNNKYEKK